MFITLPTTSRPKSKNNLDFSVEDDLPLWISFQDGLATHFGEPYGGLVLLNTRGTT